jgi:hypothetical protein
MPASDQYLEIDGVSLQTSAWWITDLRPLHSAADVRGSDRVVPGAVGVKPHRRRRTVSKRALELVIVGDHDTDGDPTVGDYADQLWANEAYLRSNVMDPTNTGDGTRSGTLHLPTGATLTGYVHVVEFTFARGGPDWSVFALGLSIPGGALT